MLKMVQNLSTAVRRIPAIGLAAMMVLTSSADAIAEEEYAKQRLQEMSDSIAKEKAISFDYNSVLGIITTDGQNLELASSGSVILNRPDKIQASRSGGFTNVETIFDGNMLTIVGKDANIYTQIELPGTLKELVDTLTGKYNRPLPASDLLLADSYQALMADVSSVLDLGSGVIDGMECDTFAAQAKDVDWQIWIAQGDSPYPCRFVISSKNVEGHPQYSVQTRNWKTGDQAAKSNFGFKNESDASQVEIGEFQDSVLPENFKSGE